MASSEGMAQTTGSSPLARGLRRHITWVTRCRGIIPARAGFTVPRRTCAYGWRDHPRSRGVYPPATSTNGPSPGSSPLARGLHGNSDVVIENVGIIPARAGFTRTLKRMYRQGRDHPRSRGVYLPTASVACDKAGSSPLARGLLLNGSACLILLRIIPARAGFTQ